MTDLVDINLIAERLGVRLDTVNKWRHREILPAPDYPELASPVWDWETIRKWAEETGRAAGHTASIPRSS
jgi:hypothetical protein